MATFKKHNNWYIDFRFNRKRYRKKSLVNSLAGAKEYEAFLKGRLMRGEKIEEEKDIIREKPTFSIFSKEWMEKYAKANNKQSEYRNKESVLRSSLLPFFGEFKIDAITNHVVENFKAEKTKKCLSPKTINNHLTVLRKCLNTASDWEIIEFIPKIKLLRVDPPKTTFFSDDECRKLLSESKGVWYEMIYVGLNTGLRFGELTSLKWCDIDFERKVLTVQRAIYKGIVGSPKSNKIRKIPLTEGVLKVLAEKKKTTGYIFSHEDGSYLSHSSCTKKIKALGKKLEIQNIGWHKIRHTFASHLANAGVAIQQIQSLLGHSDIKTTMRYAHISSASLIEAISKLQQDNNFGPHMDPAGLDPVIYPIEKSLSPALNIAQ